MNFSNSLSISAKKLAGILVGDWVESVDPSGEWYCLDCVESLVIPFQVELSYPDGSPAEGVTVQIRAELTSKDNIYTTESVSRGGLVGFEIPFIPMSAQHVWLEVGELPGPLSFSHKAQPWCLP